MKIDPARDRAIRTFLEQAGWDTAERRDLAGDASTRRYERLARGSDRAVLMDWQPGPDGPPLDGKRPYSAIAHLAESCHAFVAIGEFLRAQGLGAPTLIAQDMAAGLLLLEDLGDDLYGAAIDRGAAADGTDLQTLYRAAIDVLLELHDRPVAADLPLPDGTRYRLPAYDDEALAIESELLTDWYVPVRSGKDLDPADKRAYQTIWQKLFPQVQNGDPVLVLRDFHSPNLLWRGAAAGLGRVGLIDYQDGLRGSPAYDLVSMLQDARRDVPEEREAEMLAYYCNAASARRANFDEADFRKAYAILGAQRNAKIMGIFVRLWKRDGKPAYLAHLPRVSTYLERDLRHPALHDLKTWLDRHVPPQVRATPLTVS